jgi:hypothetical protein
MNFSSDKIGTMEKSANTLRPAFASCISLDTRIIIRTQVNPWSGLSLDDKNYNKIAKLSPVFAQFQSLLAHGVKVLK